MSRIRRWPGYRIVLAVVAGLWCASAAQAQLSDILSGKPLGLDGNPDATAVEGPESVVAVFSHLEAAGAGRPVTLVVTAQIKAPWYTYALTQKPVLATPTKIKVDASPNYRLTGDFRPNLPAEVVHKEGHTFEIHAPEVTWQAPLEIKPGVDPKSVKVHGQVRIQVCNDKSCLNPTNFDFTAEFAPATAATASELKPTGVYKHPNIHATLRGQLEPQVATPGSTVQLKLTLEPSADYHAYVLADRDRASLGYKPTLIELTNTAGFTAGRPQTKTAPVEAPSQIPGDPPQRFYAGPVTWTVPITIPREAKLGQYPIAGLVGYQTCNNLNCDQPRGAKFAGMITVAATGAAGEVPLAFSDAKYVEAAKVALARPETPADQQADVPAAPEQIIDVFGTEATLPLIVVASLIGGLILNFMPCVFPVIGLKILSFAEQAGRSRWQVLKLNLWYAAGLLSVFLVLATLASGASLGFRDTNLHWGEQFSSTTFNVTMVAIVFVMALSFLGVWEIPIPGFVGSGVAGDVAMREGAAGAFAKGVLTTVLATPCSGPLLGAVFGYTLQQPPAVTYLIFSCIGLGMASPYLIIGAFPQLLRFLPKPGAWMETFKQIMGFVMLGTIVFFFSFMNRDYLVPTFALMVGLWAACWWIGRTSLVEPLPRKLKAWAQGAAFAGLIGFLSFTWLVPHDSIIPWQNFSQAQLTNLTQEGHTVMVDFTADWCLNCKTNLRLAIETEDVRNLIDRNKVVPLLADLTAESPEIRQMLERLKSASIPVLAIFPAGKPNSPIVLRDLISKQQLLGALEQAGPSQTGAGKSLTASAAN